MEAWARWQRGVIDPTPLFWGGEEACLEAMAVLMTEASAHLGRECGMVTFSAVQEDFFKDRTGFLRTFSQEWRALAVSVTPCVSNNATLPILREFLMERRNAGLLTALHSDVPPERLAEFAFPQACVQWLREPGRFRVVAL